MIVWNRPEVLMRSIPSILTQTYLPTEIIIVGDGCPPTIEEEYRRTIAKFNSSRIRFYNLEKHIERPRHIAGLDARNHSLSLITGDYIAPLDDDDMWTPWHLERAVNIMKDDPSIDMVSGQFISLGMKKLRTEIVGQPPEEEGGIPRSLGHLTAVYRSKYKNIQYPLTNSSASPSDQGLWRLLHAAGAKIHFDPVVHGIHYSTVT